jgi:hypothetical protein
MCLAVAAAFTLALALGARPAAADGEAGLVIQHGDGSIDTYCVAFSGDSISGKALLERAPVAYEQVSGLVCAVGDRADEGCYGASSLASCTCKCRTGGSDCRYWSYFTRKYGAAWVYSALGFTEARAGNGDLQSWRWGVGGLSSAPLPAASITFEQVCGHAPSASPAQSTPTITPGAPAGGTPESPVAGATSGAGNAGGGASATTSAGAAPGAAGAGTASGAAGTAGGTPSGSEPLSTVPPGASAGAGATLPASSTRTAAEPDDGGGRLNWIAFAGVAGALVAAIGLVAWRRAK